MDKTALNVFWAYTGPQKRARVHVRAHVYMRQYLTMYFLLCIPKAIGWVIISEVLVLLHAS